MIKLRNFNVFSELKFNYLFFGIELLIFIGSLAPSAEGFNCYQCQYYQGSLPGSNVDCLDPVKNKMTPRKCDPGNCMKQTLDIGDGVVPKALYRTCSTTNVIGVLPGAQLCFKSNTDLMGKMSSVRDDTNEKEFLESLKARKHMVSKNISSIRCYCNSEACNGQSGIDTKEESGSGNSENLQVFSANFIFLLSLLLRYFLHKA